MGIGGLLPLLKSITRNVHLRDYAGQRVAVDAYCWLHKAVISCARDLGRGVPTRLYVDYCVQRIVTLLDHNIRPVIVFDGSPLPAKAGTESDRGAARRRAREEALHHDRAGNFTLAEENYKKAVDVTPRMALELIKELRALNVEYMVAPYEADAQLAFLYQHKHVSAVITEDSDLLVFGCRHVIFKLDRDGLGQAIRLDDLASVDAVSFVGWTPDRFRHLCILSGCDYLPSVARLGLRKAHKLVAQYHSPARVIQKLREAGGYEVPHDYEARFALADLAFRYQRVWDPVAKKVRTLGDIPASVVLQPEQDAYIGRHVDDETALQIALGNMDPNTGAMIDAYAPSMDDAVIRQMAATPKPKERPISSYFAPTPPRSPPPKRPRQIPLDDLAEHAPPQPPPSAAHVAPATPIHVVVSPHFSRPAAAAASTLMGRMRRAQTGATSPMTPTKKVITSPTKTPMTSAKPIITSLMTSEDLNEARVNMAIDEMADMLAPPLPSVSRGGKENAATWGRKAANGLLTPKEEERKVNKLAPYMFDGGQRGRRIGLAKGE